VRPAQTRTANTPGWSAMANELHTQLEHGVRALAMNLRGAAAMRPLPIPRACPREGAGAVRVNFGRPLLRRMHRRSGRDVHGGASQARRSACCPPAADPCGLSRRTASRAGGRLALGCEVMGGRLAVHGQGSEQVGDHADVGERHGFASLCVDHTQYTSSRVRRCLVRVGYGGLVGDLMLWHYRSFETARRHILVPGGRLQLSASTTMRARGVLAYPKKRRMCTPPRTARTLGSRRSRGHHRCDPKLAASAGRAGRTRAGSPLVLGYNPKR